MDKILNYINGELVKPVKGQYLDNYNPSTGKVYSLIADSDIEDSDRQTISKIFDSLAVAESAAHGGEVGSTHLHNWVQLTP